MSVDAGQVTMGDRLRDTAADLGDAVAVRNVRSIGDVSEISWRELDARSETLAVALLAAGVETSPATVVLLTRDAVAHAVYAFSAWKAGLPVLCLSPAMGEIEATTVLGRLGRSMSFGAVVPWDTSERIPVPEPDAVVPPGAAGRGRVPSPMLILASGGSTGTPKLIDAIGPGAFRPGDLLGGLGAALKRQPRARVFVCSPLSHGAGAATAYMGTFEQCEVTALERFDPDVALWAIEEYGLEQLTMVPTMMERMARSPRLRPDALASIRSLTHTGGIIDPDLKRRWVELIGPEKVLEVYGSTESVGHAVIAGDEWLTHPGSVGRPVNCDVVVFDNAGDPVPTGTTGEIFMRPKDHQVDIASKYVGGAQRMRTRDGYVSVGDLGYVDDDGYLYIAGRTDDLIITGGANVYPDEVEIAIRRLPGVVDCVVVGRPHHDLGTAVHAVIALDDAAAVITVDAVRRQLEGLLSTYKLPRSLETVATIARSDAGKASALELHRPPNGGFFVNGWTDIAAGLRFPEGPIAMPDGSVILVEMLGRTLTRVLPDGRTEVIAELGGGPNGAALGPDGAAYVCNNGGCFREHYTNGVATPQPADPADYVGGHIQRVDLDTGAVDVLYRDCDGEPLRAPNDIVFDGQGGFYFTDLGMTDLTNRRVRYLGAVYYAAADGTSITTAAAPVRDANGIGLSPDGTRLYWAETYSGRIMQRNVLGPGELSLATVLDAHACLYDFTDYQLLDSLAIDDDGNVCVATLISGGITTISPEGAHLDFVATGDHATTNICFGGDDRRTAFVTLSGTGRLISRPWPRAGAALHHQHR